MRMRSIMLAVSSVTLFTLPALAPAQSASTTQTTPTTSNSTQPNAEHLTAKITGVKGLVQYRESRDKPWKKCETGVVVDEGAEFRTGPRSNVQLLIPPQQTITLDRLGSMTLLEAVKASGKYTTDVGLKHGRVRYLIEAPGIEHESTVSSPNGTLAVSDTSFAVDDEQPFECEAYRLSGTVDFTTAKRTVSIGGSTPGNVKAVGNQDPADGAVALSTIDPSSALARTPAEAPLVTNLLSQGAILTETNPLQIPIISGSTPPTDAQLLQKHELPGTLEFVLRWTGNANLDLGMIELDKVETLYPVTGLNIGHAGGTIPFNNIGGPKGGIELAYWPSNYPVGFYEFIVNDISGVPTAYNMEVFLKGQLITFNNPLTGVATQSFTSTLSPGQSQGGLVSIGAGSTVPPTPPVPPTAEVARHTNFVEHATRSAHR